MMHKVLFDYNFATNLFISVRIVILIIENFKIKNIDYFKFKVFIKNNFECVNKILIILLNKLFYLKKENFQILFCEHILEVIWPSLYFLKPTVYVKFDGLQRLTIRMIIF